MDTSFCIEALNDAIANYGIPEIFNTDQGSQYTSNEFTDILNNYNIKISMDGKGRWVDNVFIERVWKSLKYECIYLYEFENVVELKSKIDEWFNFYNKIRPHSVFNGKNPEQVYNESIGNNVQNLAA